MPRVLAIALLLISMTSAIAREPDHRPVICVDPGHPSEVGIGTHGKQTTEVQVNFIVARLLAQILRGQGYNVVMTKNVVNRLVTNKRRAEIANWAHASLFLRLHCDAGVGSGFAIYYPGAVGVAADGTKGPSQHVINASRMAAVKFHAGMAQSLAEDLPDLGIKTDAQTEVGAKQGGALTGSIYSHVPTLLIEMLVLQNSHDEKWILNRQGPSKLAFALAQGVRSVMESDEKE